VAPQQRVDRRLRHDMHLHADRLALRQLLAPGEAIALAERRHLEQGIAPRPHPGEATMTGGGLCCSAIIE